MGTDFAQRVLTLFNGYCCLQKLMPLVFSRLSHGIFIVVHVSDFVLGVVTAVLGVLNFHYGY